MANEKAEELLHALAETVAEVEAETLYKTLSDMKAETLVEALNGTLVKDEGRNNWYHTGRSKNQGTARHGCCHASISEGRHTW